MIINQGENESSPPRQHTLETTSTKSPTFGRLVLEVEK